MGVSIKATLRLLSSSLIVAVSGGFKLYVAFLLVGVEPDKSSCLAFSLLVYSVYTLDRTLKCEEDIANHKRENVKRSPALLLICITLLTSALIIKDKPSPVVVALPITIGYMYTKGLTIGKRSLRLKQGLGIKNFIVAFTWAATLAIFLHPWAEILPLLLVSTFFFLKSFVNTVIYDYRDTKGDASTGLETLPIYLGEKKTTVILDVLHSIMHLGLIGIVFAGIIKFEPVIIVFSVVYGFTYIWLYANSRSVSFRDVLVDGEWTIAVLLRSLTIQLLRSASHSI